MNNLDHTDRIHQLAQKLSAMLTLTTGEPGETFRMMSHDIQNDYLWACADMACELRDLVLGTAEEKLENSNG